jgi:hypothetical protein
LALIGSLSNNDDVRTQYNFCAINKIKTAFVKLKLFK